MYVLEKLCLAFICYIIFSSRFINFCMVVLSKQHSSPYVIYHDLKFSFIVILVYHVFILFSFYNLYICLNCWSCFSIYMVIHLDILSNYSSPHLVIQLRTVLKIEGQMVTICCCAVFTWSVKFCFGYLCYFTLSFSLFHTPLNIHNIWIHHIWLWYLQ